MSLASIPNGPAKTDGVTYGDIVAKAVYDARLSDKILAPGPVYISSGVPGVYQLTTPGPPQPVNTGAPSWVPFALTSASQFRPGPPPELTSVRYARDVNERCRRARAHLPRRHRQEVLAVLPLHVPRADQAQIGLVDERRRLQIVSSALSRHAAPRDPVELGVDGYHQLFERGVITVAPGVQQLRHSMARSGGRATMTGEL